MVARSAARGWGHASGAGHDNGQPLGAAPRVPGASITVELVVIVLGNVASAVTRFILLRIWVFRRVRHGASSTGATSNDGAAS
ncbi:hypothetical protein NHF46_14800 [Arthrobacter alpinus]|nr:hypothetical protein [Arthrobacter alpinus]